VTEDAFSADGLPLLDDSPDEEAWEKYIEFALERMNPDSSVYLTNAELGRLEAALGAQLPFEIGLLLIMGVPADDGWWHWNTASAPDGPEAQLATWHEQILSGLILDLEQTNRWPTEAYGPRPSSASDEPAAIRAALDAAPKTLPLYGQRFVCIEPALDEERSEANPIWTMNQTSLHEHGGDLAAWLHADFDVPLPMWPPTPTRRFSFWSELGSA